MTYVNQKPESNDNMDFMTALKTVECTLELYIRGLLDKHDKADMEMAQNIRDAITVVKRGV